MAKTTSRPNSTISIESDSIGIPIKFGSGRWRNANQVSGTRFKICLSGKNDVGKTSIFLRLQGSDFSDMKPVCPTSTYDYYDENDSTIEYSVWDSDCEETDTLTLGDHYRNAHCVVLIYDITDFKSLEYLNYEIEKIDKMQYAPHAKFVLLQNKLDKKLSKHIPYQKQKEYIGNSKLRNKVDLLVQTSARTNEGIHEFFKNDLPELLTLPNDNRRKSAFESFLEKSTDATDWSTGKKKRKKLTCNPM